MGDPIVTEHGDTREEETSFITETRDEDGTRLPPPALRAL